MGKAKVTKILQAEPCLLERDATQRRPLELGIMTGPGLVPGMKRFRALPTMKDDGRLTRYGRRLAEPHECCRAEMTTVRGAGAWHECGGTRQ